MLAGALGMLDNQFGKWTPRHEQDLRVSAVEKISGDGASNRADANDGDASGIHVPELTDPRRVTESARGTKVREEHSGGTEPLISHPATGGSDPRRWFRLR